MSEENKSKDNFYYPEINTQSQIDKHTKEASNAGFLVAVISGVWLALKANSIIYLGIAALCVAIYATLSWRIRKADFISAVLFMVIWLYEMFSTLIIVINNDGNYSVVLIVKFIILVILFNGARACWKSRILANKENNL